MNNISNNPYLSDYGVGTFSLNEYLFNEFVAERRVQQNKLLSAVDNLIKTLKFKYQLVGSRFLTKLAVHYIVDDDYSEDMAICDIAHINATSSIAVRNCIEDALRLNPEFLPTAARLLNVPVDCARKVTVSDAVEIIGALFKIYYNMTVDGAYIEPSESYERTAAIDFIKVGVYGKSKQ